MGGAIYATNISYRSTMF
ncbi:MAG: hypothetical protein E7679_06240 [Ruminococcaceae bacterium]|nr:hypothetical protein [Oscillospiraceae bacterium]